MTQGHRALHRPTQWRLRIGLSGTAWIDQIPPGPGAQGLDGLGLLPLARGDGFFPALNGRLLLRAGGLGTGLGCLPLAGATHGAAEGNTGLKGELAGEPDHGNGVDQNQAGCVLKGGGFHGDGGEEHRSTAAASRGVKGGAAACPALDAPAPASP